MKINYNKNIEIIGEFDIIVAGAGPAGLCAAMSAAREGATVALIEKHGVVGGNLTIGHVGPLLGVIDRHTMGGEIECLLNNNSVLHHDIEKAKTTLTNWIAHENISVFLSSSIADVIMEGNNVRGVIITTQTGMKALKAKIVVDATGDGVVSYLAGAVCNMGRDSDGLVQPTTIMFTLAGIAKEQTLSCVSETDDTILPCGSYLELCKQANADGRLPKNVNVIRLYKTMYSDTERMVNATQENYVNGLNQSEIFSAEVSLRNQMDIIVEFLRHNIEGFENCYIKDSADIVGIRETRRVVGEYILTAEDMVEGKHFEDVVVHNTGFCIDIHNPDGPGQAEEPEKAYTQLHDIPYRVFVPLKIDNLLTCGRCISGTHRAHASYRVMNTAMAGGEAVGIAAYLCATRNITPRTLNYKLIQEKLKDRNIDLFD